MVHIDTRDILFICGGAFVGLEDIIRQRLGKRETGFGTDWSIQDKSDDEIFTFVTPDDLAEYGLLPEFIGRMPVVSTLDPLSVDDLVAILTEPANALTKQFRKMFAVEGVELTFTDDGLRAIAQESLERGTGARGLRSIMEKTLQETMFLLPDRDDVSRVIVDKDSVSGDSQPQLVLR